MSRMETIEVMALQLAELDIKKKRIDNLIRQVFDYLPCGIVLCDNSGYFLEWNRCAKRLLGPLNKDYDSLNDWSDFHGFHDINDILFDRNSFPITQALSGKEVTPVRIWVENSYVDNEVVLKAHPLLDESGIVVGALAIIFESGEEPESWSTK